MNVFLFIITMLSVYIYASKNPVKMSMMILILALAIFMHMSLMNGSNWIPLILTLLFTGGILIMFMILSSFHPNEGVSKAKKKIIAPLLTYVAMQLNFPMGDTMEFSELEQIKQMFNNFPSVVMFMTILILYFSVFMKIILKEKNCMRMIMC